VKKNLSQERFDDITSALKALLTSDTPTLEEIAAMWHAKGHRIELAIANAQPERVHTINNIIDLLLYPDEEIQMLATYNAVRHCTTSGQLDHALSELHELVLRHVPAFATFCDRKANEPPQQIDYDECDPCGELDAYGYPL